MSQINNESYPHTDWTLKHDTNSTANVSQPQGLLPCSSNVNSGIDRATAERVESMINMTVLPLLEFFGVITNVINCVIFARMGLKDRINLCLFSLAVADVSFLVFVFAAKFNGFLALFDKDLGAYWGKRYRNTVLGPLFGAMTVSNMMTMIISLERCICVLSPFTAKKFLKTKYMAILIVIMAVYIMGAYSLLNMKYVIVHVIDPVTHTSRWVTRITTFFRDNNLALEILYNYLLNKTVPTLSLAVMIVATSITVSRLRATMAWRQESVNVKTTLGDQRERAVTKMLSVICFIYVGTMTPTVIQAFFRSFYPAYNASGKYCNIYVIFQTLAYLCQVTNSSVNFTVYFIMGSRYRETLRELTGQVVNTKTSPAS